MELLPALDAIIAPLWTDLTLLKPEATPTDFDALADGTNAQPALIAGAAFVKTSIGFGSTGATERHVMLMRSAVGPLLGIKASGGIRSPAQAHAMLRAGANRIRASALASEAPVAKDY